VQAWCACGASAPCCCFFLHAGFLFFKGVNAANEAAERQDRMDGYIK
jgi:hypothetical protein